MREMHIKGIQTTDLVPILRKLYLNLVSEIARPIRFVEKRESNKNVQRRKRSSVRTKGRRRIPPRNSRLTIISCLSFSIFFLSSRYRMKACNEKKKLPYRIISLFILICFSFVLSVKLMGLHASPRNVGWC